MRLNITSKKADIIATKRKLVFACIVGGVGRNCGLPNPVFVEPPLSLRMLHQHRRVRLCGRFESGSVKLLAALG